MSFAGEIHNELGKLQIKHNKLLEAARAVVDKYTDPYVYAVELDPEITALTRAVKEVGK